MENTYFQLGLIIILFIIIYYIITIYSSISLVKQNIFKVLFFQKVLIRAQTEFLYELSLRFYEESKREEALLLLKNLQKFRAYELEEMLEFNLKKIDKKEIQSLAQENNRYLFDKLVVTPIIKPIVNDFEKYMCDYMKIRYPKANS